MICKLQDLFLMQRLLVYYELKFAILNLGKDTAFFRINNLLQLFMIGIENNT